MPKRPHWMRERQYFADRESECVIAIHVSLDGARDLAGAFGYDDQFRRDIEKWCSEIENKMADDVDFR